ncbi:MAG: hypothetical protein P8Y97_16805 [Candidatus Lokiarchaeota archaeon]
MEISEFEGTKAESSRHKFIKKFLLKLFLKYSHNVKMGCLEKAIQNRRADIYLELYSGEKEKILRLVHLNYFCIKFMAEELIM